MIRPAASTPPKSGTTDGNPLAIARFWQRKYTSDPPADWFRAAELYSVVVLSHIVV